MGLRINTNTSSLTALRLLGQNDKRLNTSLQRLSTGFRINRAADDPSGLVISEQLRAQVTSLRKATENASFAANLLNTSEAALNEVNAMLIEIRESAVFALNTGGASVEQINAEQDAVDQLLEAIDRVAATTRFATRSLLNGDSAFDIRARSSEITDLQPISVTFDQRSSETTFSLLVSQNASQAILSAVGATGVAASGGPVTLRVTGNLGTEDIVIPSGATLTTFQDAVNILRGNTGIYASAGMLFSEDFGSAGVIRIEQVSGTGRFTGAAGAVTSVGEFVDDFGVDARATLNGVPVRAVGNSLSVVASVFSGAINLAPQSAAGSYNFTIRNSGLLFQLSNRAVPTDQAVIGIPNIYSNNLGRTVTTTGGVESYGFLSTLTAGGDNDLHNDPGNALKIIDVAIDQVSSIRAFLGAFVHDNIEPGIRELSVAIENLTASESTIRDLDFAAETSELARGQVLFQSGISVLAQTNALSQSVLQLLQ
ncbi:MAG: flagellin [Planctomycetota bacterium]